MKDLFEVPEGSEEPEDPEEPKKAEEPDNNSPSKEEIEALRKKIEELEKGKKDLNIALHQSRQAKKEAPKQENNLTPDQIKELLAEHKDDPEVLYNLVNYIASQSAQSQLSVKETEELKAKSEAFVKERWPDIKDPGSDLSKALNNTIASLHLESHPLKNYLGIGALIAEKLPEIQKIAYEQGVEDAMKGKAKPKNLTPSSGAKGKKKAISNDTVKQLKLTKSQREIYENLIGGDEDE